MDEFKWSDWYPLSPQSRIVGVPDAPGIYEIRTDHDFGRLRENSRVVYIGSASRGNNPSLRKRLLDQRISNPERYLSRAEKLLSQAGYILEFHFATAGNGRVAQRMEAQRLANYEAVHWELPPGNGVSPHAR